MSFSRICNGLLGRSAMNSFNDQKAFKQRTKGFRCKNKYIYILKGG